MIQANVALVALFGKTPGVFQVAHKSGPNFLLEIPMNTRRPNALRRGFTLVEILIVVIILGILAAIVIPQFTNASNDARNNSVASTLQTARSQIELFKIQHGDTPPATAVMWSIMLTKSSTTEY